jgi:GYF domain 2
VPQAVAILLVAQMALAAIALFVLVDGPEWVRSHIRAIALWTVLIGGIVGLTLTIPWALTERAVTAWGFVGITSAVCLSAGCIMARDLWKRHALPIMQRCYPSSPADDEWLLFDGQVERGPFSTAELVERFSNGEVAPSDHVWKPGMDRWRPAYAPGLQRLADQAEAVPLSDARNHPRGLGNGCPPSRGVVPPWMARAWTRHHPERTRSVGT